MKPAPFEYCRPDTLEEALAVLAEFGDDALVMAGGLSLGALLNMRIVRPEAVIDINSLAELELVEIQEEEVRIGALVRQAEVLGSADCRKTLPLLVEGLRHVGHYQTRSRGTLGGSVAHADPSAETPLCLATLGGEVELTSIRGTRRLLVEEFVLGALTTERVGDEILTALYWPAASPGTRIAFQEISERHGDFAIVAAAAWAVPREGGWRYGFGLGGVEDRPITVRDDLETGCELVEDSIEEIFKKAASDFQPMGDRRASADYRAHLAEFLGKSVLRSVFAEVNE
ncbi:MAG: FAD binding domain-containing protein [Pseudomonadota bacterium]|nr:FAD binding domain-containing protein [Pseudomonadota bacterium]